jgi:hypothetical protein
MVWIVDDTSSSVVVDRRVVPQSAGGGLSDYEAYGSPPIAASVVFVGDSDAPGGWKHSAPPAVCREWIADGVRSAMYGIDSQNSQYSEKGRQIAFRPGFLTFFGIRSP